MYLRTPHRCKWIAGCVRAGCCRAVLVTIALGWSVCVCGQPPSHDPLDETAVENSSTPEVEQKPTLAEILLRDIDPEMLSSSATNATQYSLPTLDDQRLSRSGIRQIKGRYLILVTDLPESAAIDELPRVFDLAVVEWARYFGVDPDKYAGWKLYGYLMADEQRFRSESLFPEDLPRFLHGYQRGYELWLREQPSEYYRRHLLLHEGVHGFMSHHLGGMGPPWYREGIAELLATHRWKRGKLRTRVMPAAREDVAYWGRIKLIQAEFAAGRGKMINEIMQFRSEQFLNNEAYAWSWGVAAYLDGHPEFSAFFRTLKNFATESPLQFNRRVLEGFTPQLRELDEQWQLFVVNADYGYDFAAEAVQYAAGVPFTSSAQTLKVATDRGWQSSGIRVEKGVVYSISAQGQFRLKQTPEVWVSEPGGVTIEYHRGKPMGLLLGSVRLDKPRPGVANLANPFPLGLERNIRPEESGTLYLRINDQPGQLDDNQGEVTVTVALAQLSPTGGDLRPVPATAESKLQTAVAK